MGGYPILSHFSPIFGFRKFLQVFDISRGEKHCPNNGLVSGKQDEVFLLRQYDEVCSVRGLRKS